MPEPAPLAMLRRGVHVAFGEGVALRGDALAGRQVGHVPARAAGDAAEQRVDHGGVADDDGDEGFATGPAAGLLGAVCAGLYPGLVMK